MEAFVINLIASDKLSTVLLVIALVLSYFLYKAQRIRDSFDLRDLIVDYDTKRVSLPKFGQLMALIVSSWAFVHLVLHNALTEFYFVGFMGCWSGVTLISKAISVYSTKGSGQPIQPQLPTAPTVPQITTTAPTAPTEG